MRNRRWWGAGMLAMIVLGGCGPSVRCPWDRRIERGAQVFTDKGCYSCHTMGAAGTPIAPDLRHIGAKYTRTYLEAWLRDPTQYCPSHMPRVPMTERELQDLTDYLASLR